MTTTGSSTQNLTSQSHGCQSSHGCQLLVTFGHFALKYLSWTHVVMERKSSKHKWKSSWKETALLKGPKLSSQTYFIHLLCSSLFRGFMHSWRFRLGKHTMMTHGKIFQLSKLVGIHLLYKKRFMFNWDLLFLSTQHKARPILSDVLIFIGRC